ncbi:MAG TPA: phosphoribosylglycinamide formyltransferase [Burkholderiales bacterium]|nr:phosphoribosylglycinamide formyltransferase [Burkholderiales bacterium]
MKKVLILISGRGSNMEAIVRAGLSAEIAAVISNRADAAGLKFSAQAGVSSQTVDDRGFPSREAFEGALGDAIDRHSPDLIALAGFMRILGADFVRRYSGRMINIHPSLLPAFPGLHTHRRALQEGVKLHGCTVHFVTPQVDHGPIIVQAAVPVRAGDTEAMLAARVLRQEHRVYPLAIRWFVEGRLVVENGLVRVDGAGSSQSILADE